MKTRWHNLCMAFHVSSGPRTTWPRGIQAINNVECAMKKILLPTLLTSLLLQIAPASADTYAFATIDWDSLNIQLIDLSGGTNAPVLNWTSVYGSTYAYAYTENPYGSDGSSAYSYDINNPISSNATTALAQSSAVWDALAFTASSSAQEGIGNYYNYAGGSSYASVYFTLTGNGIALITVDWSIEGQATDGSVSSAGTNVYGYYYSLYSSGSAHSGYSASTTDVGNFAYGGTFSMAVLNTDPNGTSGWISASAYAYSQSPNAPVPEPETYALMLAGLGLVGFMARRRKV